MYIIFNWWKIETYKYMYTLRATFLPGSMAVVCLEQRLLEDLKQSISGFQLCMITCNSAKMTIYVGHIGI